MSDTVDFGYWAGSAALGLDSAGQLERLLPVVQEAKLFANLGGDPPNAFLLAWPDRDFGLMSCIATGQHGQSNQFVVAWPFVSYGLDHRAIVTAIYEDDDCDALRLLDMEIEGISFTAFDAFCGATSRLVTVGSDIPVRLHAWAISAERASSDPIRYKPEDVSPSMREAFAEAFERDGELVFQTDQMVALLPRVEGTSPLYEFQSPIKAVRDGRPLLDMATWVLTIAIARPDDSEETVDIELTVTGARWDGAPPQPGESIHGILWLQAG